MQEWFRSPIAGVRSRSAHGRAICPAGAGLERVRPERGGQARGVRIERHPAVIEDDLPGIHAHIARDNPAAAERLLDAVDATFAHTRAHIDELLRQLEQGGHADLANRVRKQLTARLAPPRKKRLWGG